MVDNMELDVFGEDIDDIVLTDENGVETHFCHILTFEYEGEKFMALLQIVDGEISEDEIVLLKIVHEGGADSYRTIDNEVLLDEVFAEFLRLLNEMDEDEEDEIS